jgi:DNA processing protein
VFLAGMAVPPVGVAVAIVGSRAASRYGMAQAQRLAGDLAHIGITVVSGLARGIDAAAHRGALAAGGSTIAVLPGALDHVTPHYHRDLAADVAARGALLSEHEHGAPRFKSAFLARNRLIAALAGATVVIEAAERSGAISTAAAARRLGRPVLAFPGEVDRDTAKGCHALIKTGAHLCEGAADVLAVLGPVTASVQETVEPREGLRGHDVVARTGSEGAAPGPRGATPESAVLAVLQREAQTVDAIATAAGLTLAETLAALLALQWAGVATPLPGQRWTRGRA